MASLLGQVFKNNQESVKIVFKHLPLRMHNLAQPAAIASMAAFEQGKFWEYHDELFKVKKLEAASFTKIAEQLKLDMTKFNQAINSPAIKQFISKDTHDAIQLGVNSTPSVYINGKQLSQRSLAGIQQLIDLELKKGL